jgi:uncharacterized membrane protein
MESRRTLLLRWIEQDIINKEQATEVLSALGVLPDGLRWRHFLQNLLMWLGGLALAFAMMFFIAYNWDEMGRFAKFALLEVSIAVCALTYWRLDADKVVAKILITVATILLGVLLALYGQTYQTGADTWQLFFNWALLMLPWAFVAQFASLWLIWAVLLNLSIIFYFQARGSLFWFVFSSTEDVFWVIFIFNSLLWIAWELAAKRFSWLEERWPVWLIAVASSSSITFLMITVIVDRYASSSIAVLLYFVWAGSIYFVYRKLKADLFMLAGLCFSAIVVISTFLGYHLLNNGDPVGVFLVLSIVVIGMATAAAKWLRAVQKEILS